MCVAICYLLEKQLLIMHFTHAHAKLPIKTKLQQIQLMPWRRRMGEKGVLPLGGWVSTNLLEKGHWDCYFPKKVKISVAKFAEHTVENHCEWFDVTYGFWIQGILLQEKNEMRVYIATMTPQMPNTPFSGWPVLLSD